MAEIERMTPTRLNENMSSTPAPFQAYLNHMYDCIEEIVIGSGDSYLQTVFNNGMKGQEIDLRDFIDSLSFIRIGDQEYKTAIYQDMALLAQNLLTDAALGSPSDTIETLLDLYDIHIEDSLTIDPSYFISETIKAVAAYSDIQLNSPMNLGIINSQRIAKSYNDQPETYRLVIEGTELARSLVFEMLIEQARHGVIPEDTLLSQKKIYERLQLGDINSVFQILQSINFLSPTNVYANDQVRDFVKECVGEGLISADYLSYLVEEEEPLLKLPTSMEVKPVFHQDQFNVDRATRLRKMLSVSRSIGEDDKLVELLVVCSDMEWEGFQSLLKFIPDQYRDRLEQSWLIYKTFKTAMDYRQDRVEQAELVDFPWSQAVDTYFAHPDSAWMPRSLKRDLKARYEDDQMWTFDELNHINFHSNLNGNAVDAFKVLAMEKVEELSSNGNLNEIHPRFLCDELRFYRKLFTALRLSNYVKAVGDAQVYSIARYKNQSMLTNTEVADFLDLPGIDQHWPEMVDRGLRERNLAWGKRNGHDESMLKQEAWKLQEDFDILTQETMMVVEELQNRGLKLVSYEELTRRLYERFGSFQMLNDIRPINLKPLLADDEFCLVGARFKGLRSRYEKMRRYSEEEEQVIASFYHDHPEVAKNIELQNNQTFIN